VIFVAPRIENMIIFVTLFQGIMCFFIYCSTWSEKLKALSVTYWKFFSAVIFVCVPQDLRFGSMQLLYHIVSYLGQFIHEKVSEFLHFQEFIYVLKLFS